MLESDAPDTERKIVAILKVLSESPEPLGSISIARALENHGIYLNERSGPLPPADHRRPRASRSPWAETAGCSPVGARRS